MKYVSMQSIVDRVQFEIEAPGLIGYEGAEYEYDFHKEDQHHGFRGRCDR